MIPYDQLSIYYALNGTKNAPIKQTSRYNQTKQYYKYYNKKAFQSKVNRPLSRRSLVGGTFMVRYKWKSLNISAAGGGVPVWWRQGLICGLWLTSGITGSGHIGNPLWTEWLTGTIENITFHTTLMAGINGCSEYSCLFLAYTIHVRF